MMDKKILIAEDSSVIQNLTKKILEQQGFGIATVKNGKQVIDKISDEHFDLIFMDINMPEMDGMECTRKIRSMKDINANIPIIAITGNAMNYSRDDFESTGITEVLQKPLDFDNLVKLAIKFTSD